MSSTSNKTPSPKSRKRASNGIRPEYRFDYRKARPNRFAGRSKGERLVVVLDPDIAQVFTTPESVNTVLRALITSMPPAAKPKAVTR
jgi:hypothetical protein